MRSSTIRRRRSRWRWNRSVSACRSPRRSLSTSCPVSVCSFGMRASPYHLTCAPVGEWASRFGNVARGNLSELSTAIPPGSPASARSGRRGSPTWPPEAPIRAAEVDRAVPGSTRRLAHPSHDGLCHPPADRASTIPSPLVGLKGLGVPRIERTDGIRPRRARIHRNLLHRQPRGPEFSKSPTTDHAPNAGEHS